MSTGQTIYFFAGLPVLLTGLGTAWYGLYHNKIRLLYLGMALVLAVLTAPSFVRQQWFSAIYPWVACIVGWAFGRIRRRRKNGTQ